MPVRTFRLPPEVLQSVGINQDVTTRPREGGKSRAQPFELPEEYQRFTQGSFTDALLASIKQRFSEPFQMGRELLAGGESSDVLSAVRAQREDVFRRVGGRPHLQQQIIGGLSSAAAMPLAIGARMAGRLPGAAAAGTALAGAPAYFNRRLHRESIAKSLSNALVNGAIETAGDLFQFLPLFKNRSIARRNLEFLSRSVVAELGEEQSQNLSDKLFDVQWSRPDWRRDLTTKLAKWAQEAPELARDTVIQTLVAGGSVASVSAPTTAQAAPLLNQKLAVRVAERRAKPIVEWTLANSGATWDIRNNRPIKSGYAVGAHPDRTQVLDRAPAEDDIKQYIIKNYDLLTSPNTFLGTWIDTASGNAYLDVTKVLPREAALNLARKNGELAIFDLSSGQEIRLDQTPGMQSITEAKASGVPPAPDVGDLVAKLKALAPTATTQPGSFASVSRTATPDVFTQQGAADLQQSFDDDLEGFDVAPTARSSEAATQFGVTTMAEAMFIDAAGQGLGRGGMEVGTESHERMLSKLSGRRVVASGLAENLAAGGTGAFAEVAAEHQLVRVRRDVAEFFARPTEAQIRAVSERFAGMLQALVAYSPPGKKTKTKRISDTSPAGIRRALNQLVVEAHRETAQ